MRADLPKVFYYEDPKNNISRTLTFNKDLFISFFTTIRNTDFDYDIDVMKFKATSRKITKVVV